MKGISNRIRRVLLAGTGQYEWYASAWVRGLKALEVEVIHYDWTEHWSKSTLGDFERRFMYGPALFRINNALIARAENVKPDLVLIFAGMPIWPETIKNLRRDFWVAGYHNDDPFGSNGDRSYFRVFKKAISSYCSHHVYRQENIQEYHRLGVKHVKQLKSYYLPWIDRPPELTSEERGRFGHEIVFVGHAEKDGRIQYIRDLLEAGLPLKVFGEEKYWKRYLPGQLFRRLSPIREVFDSDYRKVLAGSKICLCFFSGRNRDQYTRRVFEIPACGGFLMCQRTDVMRELYEEEIEAEFFSSSGELIRKCRLYLENDHLRGGIAAAGHRRCIESGYDVVSRMRQWLADTNGFMEKGL